MGGAVTVGKVSAGTVQTDTMRAAQVRADSTLKVANSIIIDGVNDKITSTSGSISFENTNLISNGNITSNALITNSILTGQLTIDSLHATKQIAVNSSLLLQKENTASYAEVSTTDTAVALVLQKDTAGRVGIGTTNPKEKLSVVGDVGVRGNLRLSNLGGTGNRIIVADSSGNLKLQPTFCSGLDPFWKTDGNNIPPLCSPFIGTLTNDDFTIKTANATRLTVTATGNVGIGIPNPAEKLHVFGKGKFEDGLGNGVNIGFNSVNSFVYSEGTGALMIN